MTPRLTDAGSLRIHVDKAGLVWGAVGAGPPICFRCGVTSFLQSSTFRGCERIYCLGIKQNADLIVAASEEDPEIAIFTASPLIGQGSSLFDSKSAPAIVLLGSRPVWRRVGPKERAAYVLASYGNKRENAVVDIVQHLLEQHPAWPALKMLGQFDAVSAASVLSEIADPRWFVEEELSQGFPRLYTLLGIRSRQIDRLLSLPSFVQGLYSGESKLSRLRDCLWLWSGATDTKTLMNCQETNFLRRQFKESISFGETPRGSLRMATKRLIDLIVLIWLDALSSTEVFAPEHFFAEPEVLEEYKKNKGVLKLSQPM